MSRIIEAGHYYRAHGPTSSSNTGWKLLEKIRANTDKTLLWIDDVHGPNQVPEDELRNEVISFNPCPDFLKLESEMIPYAHKVFELLKNLPKRKRPRQRKDGGWSLNGRVRLYWSDGFPSCVLLDAGLSLWKNEQGFQVGVNILPECYAKEQLDLLLILRKSLPNFRQEVLLFNEEGELREISLENSEETMQTVEN